MCISWPESSAGRAMQKSRGGGQHVYLRFEVKGREGGRQNFENSKCYPTRAEIFGKCPKVLLPLVSCMIAD